MGNLLQSPSAQCLCRVFAALALLSLPLLTLGCWAGVAQSQYTPVSEKFGEEPTTHGHYVLYVPSTYDSRFPCPVIVTCAGGWAPVYDVPGRHIQEWKTLAENHGWIVVAPWVGQWVTSSLWSVEARMHKNEKIMRYNEKMILGCLSLLRDRYNIDEKRVCITGLRSGGYATYGVGLRHPDVFAAIVARKCSFTEDFLPLVLPPGAETVPVLVYWDERDSTEVHKQSLAAVDSLRSKGLTVEKRIVAGAWYDRRPEIAMGFFLKQLGPALAKQSSSRGVPVVSDGGGISCDIRLVDVGRGTVVGQANGTDSQENLLVLAKNLAGDLQAAPGTKGQSVAVVSLRNRSRTEVGATVCEEVADKLTNALVAAAWFQVRERIDLRKLVDEKDLDSMGIVNNPAVRRKFAGAKFIVIGGVTVTE